VHLGYDLDEAVDANPDVVMMLRIQAERMNAAFFPNTREYARQWGLDDARLSRLRADTMVMHPGPMIRGLEISASAADSSRSTVLEQVANGVSIRMAVLYLLLSGTAEQ
jgi:aspartate carbamoyltransferase catalytic subunit